MLNAVRVVLMSWFIVGSLLLFVPSAVFLSRKPDAAAIAVPPTPPAAPAPPAMPDIDSKLDPKVIEQLVLARKHLADSYTQQVAAFNQHVSAYTQQLTAYKVYAEQSAKAGPLGTYDAIVNKTIQPLISTVLAALLAFAFVRGSLGVVDNYNRMKKNQPPEPLRFF